MCLSLNPVESSWVTINLSKVGGSHHSPNPSKVDVCQLYNPSNVGFYSSSNNFYIYIHNSNIYYAIIIQYI